MHTSYVQRLLQDMNEETKGEIADNVWLKKQVGKMAVCLFIGIVHVYLSLA